MADTFSDDYYKKMREQHFQFDQELYDLSQDVLEHDSVADPIDSPSIKPNKKKAKKKDKQKAAEAEPDLNLTIDKLRSEQNDRHDLIEKFVKDDEQRHQRLVSFQTEVAHRKAVAQKAIIRKVNAQPKKINKDEDPTSDINFIKPAIKNFDEKILEKAQDKLNYTLQMDVLTVEKIEEIKEINDRSKLLNNKFAKLDPFIHKIYVRMVSILSLLVIAIVLIVILL